IPVVPVTAANEDQTTMDRAKLIAKLGLAATATDEDIEKAIGDLQTKNAANETQIATLTAERDAEKAKVTTLTVQLNAANEQKKAAETEAANERQRSRDLLIEQGIRDGKILQHEKDGWK